MIVILNQFYISLFPDMSSLRQEVLHLYRRILHLSRTWESALGNPGATETERQYIADEARKLFKKNKHVS